MKYLYIFSCAVFLFTVSRANGQDQRSLQTKVADILNQIPARDINHRNQLAESMLQLGSEGLNAFTAMVVPDGSGDDTRVRTALNGLILYAGQPGKEMERQQVSATLRTGLERANDPLVKAFFLYHLPFLGKGEIIPSVAPYLTHTELADDAVQALVAIREAAAASALLDAYTKAPEALKPVLIQGVAAYAPATAEAFFRTQATATDPVIRKHALRGLAKIGMPGSEKLLLAAAKSVQYGYDPTEATRSALLYTEALIQHGYLAPGKSLAAALIKATAQTPQYTTSLAALDILAQQFGMDAFDQILTALEHPRADYRAAALQSAARIQDVAATRRLIDKANTAAPEAKAQIIAHLGKEKRLLAASLIAQHVGAADPRIRAAALDATAALHGSAALPTLLDAARQTRSEAEKNQLFLLINACAKTADAPALLNTLAAANAAGKALVIDVLSARHAKTAFQPVLAYTKDGDAGVSNAAYQALASLAQSKDLPQLLELLDKTTSTTHVTAVQQALVSIADAGVSQQIQRAWSERPALQSKLLGTLPQIGGASMLGLAREAYQNNTLKKEAFKALIQWKEVAAAPLLIDIVRNTSDQEMRKEAAQAYLRVVSQSSLHVDQKVLQLDKLLDLAAGQPELQKAAIGHLSRIKSFPAFLAVSRYLNQPTVQSDAAWAISRIALPGSDGKTGLYGDEVRAVLEQSIAVISGPESDYAKENIRNWIRQMPKDAGFVSLFNGKDLTGWQGLVGNPISRAAMTPEALAQAQREADAKLPQNWTVRDGFIRFTGTGFENLCTTKSYGDIEMWVDWRINKGGDSGIYLRGTPQVQIWDTSLVAVGAQVGSGGLYNNQKNPSKPLKVADNPVGEWNTFFIRMLGDKVTVYLNGELVTDQVTLENYWNRALPIFANGPLELQAHGTDLAFRNIYVREIKPSSYQLTPEEIAEGYVALFNGKDLTGWVGNKVDYKVVDQAIMIDPSAGGNGNLYTEKEYGNFSYRFEFQLTPGANNGIGIRTPLEGDAAYVGMEIQVLDNTSPIYANLQPYQYHGSVYGVIPAKREFLRPVGQWNEEEIRIEGNHIRVTLNGTVIVDGDLYEASKNGTIDKNEHPGLKRTSGHIGFLGHGSEVRFRNIRIKTL